MMNWLTREPLDSETFWQYAGPRLTIMLGGLAFGCVLLLFLARAI